MLIEKGLRMYKGENVENTDIPTKKIKKKLVGKNPFISAVSRMSPPGIADIAAKKKIKDLTFIF